MVYLLKSPKFYKPFSVPPCIDYNIFIDATIGFRNQIPPHRVPFFQENPIGRQWGLGIYPQTGAGLAALLGTGAKPLVLFLVIVCKMELVNDVENQAQNHSHKSSKSHTLKLYLSNLNKRTGKTGY